MKCKKILLVSSLFAAMAISNVANAADTSNTEIRFTGVFQETTCTVTLDGKDIASGPLQVSLGLIKPSVLKEAKSASGVTSFDIKFSNCGVITKADLAFTGDQTTDGLFNVVSEINKDKVGVGITKEEKSEEYLKNTDKEEIVFVNEGYENKYFARSVKIGANPVDAGQTDAIANLSITYR